MTRGRTGKWTSQQVGRPNGAKIGVRKEMNCKQHGDSYHSDSYHGDGCHGDGCLL